MTISQIAMDYIDCKVCTNEYIDLLIQNISDLKMVDKEFLSNEFHSYVNSRIELSRYYFDCEEYRLNPYSYSRPWYPIIEDTLRCKIITDIENMNKKVGDGELVFSQEPKGFLDMITISAERAKHVQYLLDDVREILNINNNPMVINGINICEYLETIKNFMMRFHEYPLCAIYRFSKTMENFIDDHLSPVYKKLLSPKVRKAIEKTLPFGMNYMGNYYGYVNNSVMSFSPSFLSMLLRRVELLLEYFGDIVIKQVDDYESMSFEAMKSYHQIFPKLPHDIHKYIFEFSSVPLLKFQKQIDQAPQDTVSLLKDLQNELGNMNCCKNVYWWENI